MIVSSAKLFMGSMRRTSQKALMGTTNRKSVDMEVGKHACMVFLEACHFWEQRASLQQPEGSAFDGLGGVESRGFKNETERAREVRANECRRAGKYKRMAGE